MASQLCQPLAWNDLNVYIELQLVHPTNIQDISTGDINRKGLFSAWIRDRHGDHKLTTASSDSTLNPEGANMV